MFPFKLTPRSLACGLPCALLVASCSGGASGPAAPFAPTTLSVNQPAATTGTTISGTVKLSGSSSSGASLRAALGPPALLVRVVGTALEAAADPSGRFTLEGVPPGDVQLHFGGSGINATLTLPSVQAEQTVIIVVVLTGNGATLESDSRNGSVDDDDSADDDAADDDSVDDDDSADDDDAADDDSRDDDDSTDDDAADDDSKDDDSKDGGK